MADVWRRRGWKVHRVARIAAPGALPHGQAKLYGDYEFCVVVARALGLALVSPPDDLLARLPASWLGRSVSVMPLRQARDASFPLFVKPVAPKIIRARVFPTGRALLRETQGIADETPVIASEPVLFKSEVRCLVLHGQVVSAACYHGAGNIEEAVAFVNSLLGSFEWPVTFVLDVGSLEKRGWAIVEANAVWGAGLNGCDPAGMADCVLAATFAA